MKKTEPKQKDVQSQTTVRKGGEAAFASPQDEQFTQLEAMIESSPQAEKLTGLATMINDSPTLAAQRTVAGMIHSSPRQTALHKSLDGITAQQTISESMFSTMQRNGYETPLQGKFEPVPRVENEELVQEKFTSDAPAQLERQYVAKPNNTGLPDNLKSGIESLSGLSMDNVRVHYNSSQPTQLNALAYAQGNDIHVAPGQEKHLPHEAWHVVQQTQGRVRPTMQLKDGVPVNDDQGLEHEADMMGEKALLNVRDIPTPANLIDPEPVSQHPISAQKRQLQQSDGTAQLVAVVQMVKGDELLVTATRIAVNLNDQLELKNYTQALEYYAELKDAAKDLNERRALSSREDEVYNRHIDGTIEAPGVNLLLKSAIKKFKEVVQPDYDSAVQEVMVFVEHQEGEYRTAFDKMLNDIISGNKEAAQLAKKIMKSAAIDFEREVKKKGKVLSAFSNYSEKAKSDKVVTYIQEKGKGEKGDRTSNIEGTTLHVLDNTKFLEMKSKNNAVKNLMMGNAEKSAELTMPEKEGEISSQTKTKAIAILAGSEERRLAIANILPDNIPNQLSVFAALKPHHSSEEITNVTRYLMDMELTNLDTALSFIRLVGEKGTVAEINAFQKAIKTVMGTPSLPEVGSFLTGLDYPDLASITVFITPVGKLCDLTNLRKIWGNANTNKSRDATLNLLGEGIIPERLKSSAADILEEFSKKTGKSSVEDWRMLLAIPEWSLEEVLGLALGFDNNDGNVKAADWVTSANADVTLKGKPDEVRAQARLNMFANDDWYDKQDVNKLSTADRAKKKYTQLLYALLGKENLNSLKDIDLDAMRGDFLSMLLFFHKHIASFQSGAGQGFDRGSEAPGTYSRSDKTHPLNAKYKLLAGKLGIDTRILLQPLNTRLLGLQGNSRIAGANRNNVDYHTGDVGVASAGLPSHNLKNLDQQQLITSKLIASKTSLKSEYLHELFETGALSKTTKVSRTLDDKSAVTDELVKKQKATLSGRVGKSGSHDNFHDFLIEDRGKVVSALSTIINSITGGSEDLYAISTEGHPNLVLLCPATRDGRVKYGGTTYDNTKKILPTVVNDFNGASGQEVKITQRGSFGFQRPTVTDTAESIRIWPGYAPVEALIPGLKAVISKLRKKGPSETLGKLSDLDGITTASRGPVLHIEALKAAMRHAMIVMEEKVQGGATPEKKRVGEWVKTRLLIKLKQAGILLQKGAAIYGQDSNASASEKNKHYLVTADMTDKLQEYSMIYAAATLVDTVNQNASHTSAGKFKDSNDAYENRLASKFSGLDYRVYYLDSGEQALVTAGILANRFEKGKDETAIKVDKSYYINRNPYFEIGVYKGDKRSNLEEDSSGKIVHADLSPVITSGRTAPKPKAEINKEIRETWQKAGPNKSVKHADMIPIIDITNSGLDAVKDLGNMPNNFIIVESLTKHAQLGADKFIMGRLIALSTTAGTSRGQINKANFLDLSQKIVGPVANAAYNPLLAKIRANMDKALYTEETS